MKYKTLKLFSQPMVQHIQICCPETENALNSNLLMELYHALKEAETNCEIKIVVLEGLPTVFCVGVNFNELSDFAQGIGEHPLQDPNEYFELLKHMTESSKIIVSCVRGTVRAGGVGLVAASDLVIADESAIFTLSELLFGLLPACVLPFLMRRVGFQRAYRLALTTQPLSVNDAYQWGLVDDYSSDVNKSLKHNLHRLRRIPSRSVSQLKTYVSQLWPIQDSIQELAVKNTADLMHDREVRRWIQDFVQEEKFPWQS